MMTSSSDELLRRGAEPAVVDRASARRPRQAHRTRRHVRCSIARGTITGLLGPSGCGKTTLMRSIVGTQIIAAGTVTVLGQPAGSAELRSRVGYVTQDRDHLRRSARHRQRALLRVAVRHRRAAPPTRRSPPSDSTIIEPRCAATCPAVSAPACRWPARWWRTRTCWCSTSPPSASTPCCGSTCGSSSTSWPGAAPPCWCPAT